MVVINVDSKGNFKNSSPCCCCAEELKKYKINTVYYSTSDNEIVKKKTKDLGWHMSSSQIAVQKKCFSIVNG